MNTELNLSTATQTALAQRPMASQAASAPLAAEPNKIIAPKHVELSIDPEESRRNLKEAIAHLNDSMQKNQRDLSFAIDDSTDSAVITVKSATTGEVVRQIPNETVLRVAHNIDSVKGLMHNSKN